MWIRYNSTTTNDYCWITTRRLWRDSCYYDNMTDLYDQLMCYNGNTPQTVLIKKHKHTMRSIWWPLQSSESSRVDQCTWWNSHKEYWIDAILDLKLNCSFTSYWKDDTTKHLTNSHCCMQYIIIVYMQTYFYLEKSSHGRRLLVDNTRPVPLHDWMQNAEKSLLCDSYVGRRSK